MLARQPLWRWQRDLRRRKSKIDDCSRQNSAYRYVCRLLNLKGAMHSRIAPFRPKTNSFFTPLKEKAMQKSSFISALRLDCFCIRNKYFYCIFKGFHEILRLLYFCTATLEFREKYPHFSHSVQCADFVCKLNAPVGCVSIDKILSVKYRRIKKFFNAYLKAFTYFVNNAHFHAGKVTVNNRAES